MSMNYNFSMSNGLHNHSRDINLAWISSWWTWDSNLHGWNARLCRRIHSGSNATFVMISCCFFFSIRNSVDQMLDCYTTCCGPRTVINTVFHPFHALAFLDYPHLIRNLYRYSKPYPPHLIVPHQAHFHPIHHYSALHYPAPPCSHTQDNSISDTLNTNPYYSADPN